MVIERDEDGMYVGEVPQLRACYSQGQNIDELMANMREVIELCLEEAEESYSEFIGMQRITIMMPHLPVLNARQSITALERAGFEMMRQKGSHVRLRHPDGRVRSASSGPRFYRHLLRRPNLAAGGGLVGWLGRIDTRIKRMRRIFTNELPKNPC